MFIGRENELNFLNSKYMEKGGQLIDGTLLYSLAEIVNYL